MRSAVAGLGIALVPFPVARDAVERGTLEQLIVSPLRPTVRTRGVSFVTATMTAISSAASASAAIRVYSLFNSQHAAVYALTVFAATDAQDR